MTHTAELHTAITPQEYAQLIENKDGIWERNREGKTRYHIRSLSAYGITDIQPRKLNIGWNYYYCSIIINLQRIVNDGARSIYTYDNESDFPALSANFEKYISTVLPLRTDINQWSLQRIDYNIDLKLTQKQVEQYITLLQRGGKHYSWNVHELAEEKEKRKKNKHGNRKKTHPEGSVIYDNKQYSVNIYNKYKERLQVQAERAITDTAELKESEGVLRIEIQVKKDKLNSVKKKIKEGFDFEGKPIELFARYGVAVPLIMKVLENICGTSNYATLTNAVERIERDLSNKTTISSCIAFLELVGRSRSLWRALQLYNAPSDIHTVLKQLKRLDINPVTIPLSFKVDSLDSVTNLVAVHFAEQMSAGRLLDNPLIYG